MTRRHAVKSDRQRAFDYLSRFLRLKDAVEEKKQRIAFLRSAANRLSSALGKEPVSNTPDVTAMQERLARIMDMEKELEQQISGLSPVSREIEETLLQMPDPDICRVLDLRYFSGKSFPEIAAELHFSLSWIKKLHSRGLDVVGKQLEEGRLSWAGDCQSGENSICRP